MKTFNHKHSLKKRTLLKKILIILPLIMFFIIATNFTIKISATNRTTITNDELTGNYQFIISYENKISFNLFLTPSSRLEYFYINSYLIPQNYSLEQGQTIIENSFTNKFQYINKTEGQFKKFSLKKEDLKNGKNVIKSIYILQKRDYAPKIYHKVSFPITKNYSRKYQKYLTFNKNINLNDKLKKKASELAYGKTDLYELTLNIAKWVNQNVKYNLSKVKIENISSTQTLDTLNGVCKNKNNLFVSMLRYLGIPVRIVTGFCYTNNNQLVQYLGNNWGGHVWSEVFIDNTWVPFDVTYGEYGFIDPTHIIFSKSVFNNNGYVHLNSSGYNLKLGNTIKTENTFKILNIKNLGNDTSYKNIHLNITTIKKLGFNSYDYFLINISNDNPFYVIQDLDLAYPTNIKFLDPPQRTIILSPNSHKTLLLRFQIQNKDLDKNYLYTIPFIFLLNNKEKIHKDLIMTNEFKTITKNELNQITTKFQSAVILNKTFTNHLLQFNLITHYFGNDSSVDITLKNNNNINIQKGQICLDNNCRPINLKINEKKIISIDHLQNKKYLLKVDYQLNNKDYLFKKNITFKIPSLSVKITKIKNSKTEEEKLNGISKYLLTYNIQNYNPSLSVCIEINNKNKYCYLTKSSIIKFHLNNRINNSVEIYLQSHFKNNTKTLKEQTFKIKAIKYTMLDQLKYYFNRYITNTFREIFN